MDIFNVTTQQILERIARHCPEALGTYLHCLNRADENGTTLFTKQMIEMDMSESWTRFLNNVKKLAREDLLQWHFFNKSLSVTLVATDEHE